MFPPMPPGMPPMPPDPMAGGPARTPPGMPPRPLPPMMARPGSGMDPMQAMLQGLGPDPLGLGGMLPPAPPRPPGPPTGPNGLPVGGSAPPPGPGGEDMGGSALLRALASSVGGGGDPYAARPFDPGIGLQGLGTGDPIVGIGPLLQLLALGRVGAGGSGVEPDIGVPGQMVGF